MAGESAAKLACGYSRSRSEAANHVRIYESLSIIIIIIIIRPKHQSGWEAGGQKNSDMTHPLSTQEQSCIAYFFSSEISVRMWNVRK